MLVKASLSDVKHSVSNAYGLGLIFQGEKYDTAIWDVGNCLLVARKEAELFTDVIPYPFRRTPLDDEAAAAWNHLCARWEEMDWVTNPDYADTIDNRVDRLIDNEALVKLPMPNEAEWKASWIRDHYLLGSLADSDEAITRKADVQWRTFREFIEGLKNEAKAREVVANKTAARAADEFWEWIKANQSAEARTDDRQRGKPDVTQQSGGINVDANQMNVGNDLVAGDKILKIYQYISTAQSISAPSDNLSARHHVLPFPLNPSSSSYWGQETVSLLIRIAFMAHGTARKPWLTEEREAIPPWLKASPLCRWIDSHLNMQDEEFSWNITQSWADTLWLSYVPKLPPVDSPLSAKAVLYTGGIAYFDVIFGTLETMDRFLSQRQLSSSFLGERARRFQGEQRLSWSEACQLTLAGLATVTHAKFLEWFPKPNESPRLCVYLLANGAALDQRIGGDSRWKHTEGIAGRDTFLQGDDLSEGVPWQAKGLEELNDINQRMWENTYIIGATWDLRPN